MDYYSDLGLEIESFAKGGMPARNKKNYRSTKSGAGMTTAGVKKMHNVNCSKTPDKRICAARRRWKC